jgi:hypothetical protein
MAGCLDGVSCHTAILRKGGSNMAKFSKLQSLLGPLEAAEMRFDMRTRDTFNEARLAEAAKDFNVVLEQAASAILEEVPNTTVAQQYREEWRPKSDADTWFGSEPMTFIRHVLRDGTLHRMGSPEASSVH